MIKKKLNKQIKLIISTIMQRRKIKKSLIEKVVEKVLTIKIQLLYRLFPSFRLSVLMINVVALKY